MRFDETYGSTLPVEIASGELAAEFTLGEIEANEHLSLCRAPLAGLGIYEGFTSSAVAGIKASYHSRRYPKSRVIRQPSMRPLPTTGGSRLPESLLDLPKLNVRPPLGKVSPTHPLQALRQQREVEKAAGTALMQQRQRSMFQRSQDIVEQAEEFDRSRAQAALDSMQAKAGMPWFDHVVPDMLRQQGIKVDIYKGVKLKGLPSPIYKKAQEIRQGGFIGGKVGERGRQLVALLLKLMDEAKELGEKAERAPVSSGAALKNQAAAKQAEALTLRARIERLRYASLVKLYEIVKKEMERRSIEKATKTGGSERERHIVEASKQRKLAEQAQDAYKELTTRPLQVPGLSNLVSQLMQNVTIRKELRGRSGVPADLVAVANRPQAMVARSTVAGPRPKLPYEVLPWQPPSQGELVAALNPRVFFFGLEGATPPGNPPWQYHSAGYTASILGQRRYGMEGATPPGNPPWQSMAQAHGVVAGAVNTQFDPGLEGCFEGIDVGGLIGGGASLVGGALSGNTAGVVGGAASIIDAVTDGNEEKKPKVGAGAPPPTGPGGIPLRSGFKLHSARSERKSDGSYKLSIRFYKLPKVAVVVNQFPFPGDPTTYVVTATGVAPWNKGSIAAVKRSLFNVPNSSWVEADLPRREGVGKYIVLSEGKPQVGTAIHEVGIAPLPKRDEERPGCPAGQIPSPTTGRCIPKPTGGREEQPGGCPAGMVPDPATGRCVPGVVHEERPWYKSTAVLIGGGLGVAALATGAVLLARKRGAFGDAEDLEDVEDCGCEG